MDIITTLKKRINSNNLNTEPSQYTLNGTYFKEKNGTSNKF